MDPYFNMRKEYKIATNGTVCLGKVAVMFNEHEIDRVNLSPAEERIGNSSYKYIKVEPCWGRVSTKHSKKISKRRIYVPKEFREKTNLEKGRKALLVVYPHKIEYWSKKEFGVFLKAAKELDFSLYG